MRLKRLEIYGFKSFADRVEMVFPDGVTGVVGPNGSGKSNIADAVRWVLGEQSAKTLRGAKMEDVIFGGTQTRKAQAYCEVSLVFDNEDGALPVSFAEVMITRRVYRNGDSEYCLNKAPCRLKDIVDLLRDTGIGISQEYLAHLFEPYSRDASAYEQGTQGSGLGLAIVKAIVDRMGGRISVRSELGQGSAFSVHLELLAAMQAPAAPAAASLPPGALKDCRVLLAEDNATNARITTHLLEREGVRVERAENGRIAVERFRESPMGHFDAILMDIRMPEMDGLSAASRIRALDRPDARAVPILAMTADAFGADVQRALAAGMNDHLAKPIEPAQLYRALACQLRRTA